MLKRTNKIVVIKIRMVDMSEKALELLGKELQNLCKTPRGRRMFLASLPLIVSGCATRTYPKQQHRHREGNNQGQQVSLNPAGERQMTVEYLPQMEKEYPTIKNSYLQGYVQRLGKKITTTNGLEGRPYNYNFRIVEAKMINAFALPAGEVFVTAPLVLKAKSEAELAGVIGHEIGHIQARHTAERMHEAQKNKTKNLLFGLGGAILGGAAGYGLGKMLCKKTDRKCLKRVSLYGALAGGAGTLLIQKFAFMANSREDEMEADRIGFKTAMKAGYHPQYIGQFYNELYKMEQQYRSGSNSVESALADAMSTHPPGKDRVNQMNQMASQAGRSGKITSNEFKKVQKLLS